MPPVDPKEQVRRGYDAVSVRYRGDDDTDERYAEWVKLLRQRVGPWCADDAEGDGDDVARSGPVDDGVAAAREARVDPEDSQPTRPVGEHRFVL